MNAPPVPMIAELQELDLDDLDVLFASERAISVPEGRFRGVFLRKLATEGARKPFSRVISYVGFEATPFGVDFDTCCWYFWHPRLQVGRFRPEVGPSRWRDTHAVSLHYEVSRLPAPIRGVLYDEVKPLDDSMCLGIGGLNAERGEGDLFYFALERIG
jgi:hypothetical protein